MECAGSALLTSLRNGPGFTDIVIDVLGENGEVESFACHKLILTTYSSYFASALTVGMADLSSDQHFQLNFPGGACL